MPKLQILGKIWQALNLAISVKTPVFLIWRISNLVIRSPNQNIVWPPRSRASLPHGNLPSKVLREVSSSLGWNVIGAIPSHLHPLLRCILPVICLTSRWTVLEHVGQRFRACLIHSLATRNSFPEREKNSRHCILWRVYRYISWSTITSRLALQGLILVEINLAIFF